jgi:hypothetical protein
VKWFFDKSNLSRLENKDLEFITFGPKLIEIGPYFILFS